MLFKTDNDIAFNIYPVCDMDFNPFPYELAISGFWFPVNLDSHKNFYVQWDYFSENSKYIDAATKNYINKFGSRFGRIVAFV